MLLCPWRPCRRHGSPLFPVVTNLLTRHASVLASAIQAIAELAPGRLKCIIGIGYTSASTIGCKPATLAQMRACIHTVKALLAGDAVDFEGTPGRLGYAAGQAISVLMVASSPKAIELAGEVADIVLLLVGYTPGVVDAVLARLEQGARRSGQHLGSAPPGAAQQVLAACARQGMVGSPGVRGRECLRKSTHGNADGKCRESSDSHARQKC
jgi:alkanesulfonate monooxygenase SsuD/methylene tetrahydromethanopterin reductase-like flavin-dependent oxidoreductase (luciferase family)